MTSSNPQTESMVDLLDELNQMSELIKNNSTWEKILQSTGDMPKPLTPGTSILDRKLAHCYQLTPNSNQH